MTTGRSQGTHDFNQFLYHLLTDQCDVVLPLLDVPEDEVGEVDLGDLDLRVGRPDDELLLLRRDLGHLVLGGHNNGGPQEPEEKMYKYEGMKCSHD